MQQWCRKYTFEMPLVKKYVEAHCVGKVLNLFAGKTMLNLDEIRVDLDPNMPADYHMDAEKFLELAIQQKMKFDTVILDPPYSIRKSMEKYKGKYVSSFRKIKDMIPLVLNYRGIVITFGYNSSGFKRKVGFKKIAICLICHYGAHHDTVVLVEKKITPMLG